MVTENQPNSDLISGLTTELGDRGTAERAVQYIADYLAERIINGERAELPGLGNFERTSDSRNASLRSNHINLVLFTAGHALIDTVNAEHVDARARAVEVTAETVLYPWHDSAFYQGG